MTAPRTPDAAAIAAIKTALAPQIDAALTSFLFTMNETMTGVSASAIDTCISVVESCAVAPVDATAADWNRTVTFIADRLRAWKVEASRP